MHIVGIIVIGFVAGIIARFLAPGPNNPAGFILTAVLGIAGAFVATMIGQAVGWYRRGLYPTPVPDVGCRSGEPRRWAARGPALDDDGTLRSGAAGNGQLAGVLARRVPQHGAARIFGRDRHQRHDDLDLTVDVLSQALRRDDRVVERRRVSPHAAAAVLRIPYVAHSLSSAWHGHSARIFAFQFILSLIYRSAQ